MANQAALQWVIQAINTEDFNFDQLDAIQKTLEARVKVVSCLEPAAASARAERQHKPHSKAAATAPLARHVETPAYAAASKPVVNIKVNPEVVAKGDTMCGDSHFVKILAKCQKKGTLVRINHDQRKSLSAELAKAIDAHNMTVPTEPAPRRARAAPSDPPYPQ
jgi:hypothetical protein